MKDLSKFVLERTGWVLTDAELTKLYTKYCDEHTRVVNLKKLVDDLRKAVLTHQSSTLFLDESSRSASASYFTGTNMKSSSPFRSTNGFDGMNMTSSPSVPPSLPAPSKTESGIYGSAEFANTSQNKKSNRPPMTFNQIMEALARQITQRINLLKGDNKLKKAYLLISESRSPVINRHQLKISLQTRLGIFLKDSEIEEIFAHLDPMCDGTINIRNFINMIMKSEREFVTLSLQFANDDSASISPMKTTPSISKVNTITSIDNNEKSSSYRPSTPNSKPNTPISSAKVPGSNKSKSTPKGNQWDHNDQAMITYDKLVVGLQPPSSAFCRPYSVEETENFIWEKVFERSNLNDNMIKTLIRLFSDGESHQNSHDQVISLDLMRYTLWKRLKMNITDADLVNFFRKYASKNAQNALLPLENQSIDMFDFIDGIIRNRSQSKSFLEDRSSAASGSGFGDRSSDKLKFARMLMKSHYVEEFLILVRQQLNELTNRESRAPHYLLHHNDRMTLDQAKQFFATKLSIHFNNFSPEMTQDILQEYCEGNLVDVKHIILDAMTMKEDKVRFMGDAVGVLPSQTLVHGAAVSVDSMPSSLKKIVLTPQRIEEIIIHKCEERQKTDHPHATLFKLFRDSYVEAGQHPGISSNHDAQHFISRKGMKSVLHKFDILTTPEEFEVFFMKHANADGTVDVHKFLRHLMPAPNMDQNPFTPKDPSIIKQQQTLAFAVEELTGKRRDVSALNGPSFTRLDTKFLHEVDDQQMDMESEEISSGVERSNRYGASLGDVESKSPTESNWVKDQPSFPITPMSINVTVKSPATSRPSSSSVNRPSPSLVARKNKSVSSSQESPRPKSPRPLTQQNSQSSTLLTHSATSSPVPNKIESSSFNEQFYSGNFNLSQAQAGYVHEETKSTQRGLPEPSEKKIIAESLIHAMRDLPNLSIAAPSGSPSRQNHQNDNFNEEQYKLMQSQHLMALAQAYAQSVNISPRSPTAGNSNSGVQTPSTASPRRPKSTQPSKSSNAHQNFSSTLKHFEATDSGMKPVATPDPNTLHSPRDASPRADRRFTDNGQKKHANVNPFNHRLLKMYKYTGRQCTTTHEEYGFFLKNLEKAIHKRRNLYSKQEEELKLTGKKM